MVANSVLFFFFFFEFQHEWLVEGIFFFFFKRHKFCKTLKVGRFYFNRTESTDSMVDLKIYQ